MTAEAAPSYASRCPELRWRGRCRKGEDRPLAGLALM